MIRVDLAADNGVTCLSIKLENKEQAKGALVALEAMATCGDLLMIELIKQLKEYIKQ